MKLSLKNSLILAFTLVSSLALAQKTNYKCMLQLKNYKGEGAYIVASLVIAKGAYIKTLAVMGDDAEWYNTLKEWHKFQKVKKEKLDAITGASVSPGNRAAKVFEIDTQWMNKGFKIRFESAVEDQSYHIKDVEIPLTDAEISQKYEGKGYIRFIKLNKI